MGAYVALIKFTEQGLGKIKESTKRAEAFRKEVARTGGTIREILWTVGRLDGVVVFDAPDDAVAAALLLRLGMKGNVRTETLRAYDAKEFESILRNVRAT